MVCYEVILASRALTLRKHPHACACANAHLISPHVLEANGQHVQCCINAVMNYLNIRIDIQAEHLHPNNPLKLSALNMQDGWHCMVNEGGVEGRAKQGKEITRERESERERRPQIMKDKHPQNRFGF